MQAVYRFSAIALRVCCINRGTKVEYSTASTVQAVHYTTTSSTNHLTPAKTNRTRYNTHTRRIVLSPQGHEVRKDRTLLIFLARNAHTTRLQISCLRTSENDGSFHRLEGSWMMPQDPGRVQVKITCRSRHLAGRLTPNFAQRQKTI